MDVNQVLRNISKRQEEITVLTKPDKSLDIDLGTLTAWDPSVIALPKAKAKQDDYLRKLARDGVQKMLNRLDELSELVEGERMVTIPDEPTTILPRARPVPQPKPPTKWEQFAKRKGIKSNKNREKLVWDDTTRQWVPRFGYKKAQNERLLRPLGTPA